MEDKFVLEDTIELLKRTPAVLRAWLTGFSEEWTNATEGPDTWSPYDVVGHLIHGEEADWMPRAKHILRGDGGVPFEPFDRFAQFHDSQGKSLDTLLDEFEVLRQRSLTELADFELGEEELEMTGTHPAFGTVTLRQLLATWTVHDLTHLAQIARVMAKRYGDEVGPWKQYLSVLRR